MRERLKIKNNNQFTSTPTVKKMDYKSYIVLFIFAVIGILFIFMLITLVTRTKTEEL